MRIRLCIVRGRIAGVEGGSRLWGGGIGLGGSLAGRVVIDSLCKRSRRKFGARVVGWVVGSSGDLLLLFLVEESIRDHLSGLVQNKATGKGYYFLLLRWHIQSS